MWGNKRTDEGILMDFNLLAKLLEYPKDDFKDLLIKFESSLDEVNPEFKNQFSKFSIPVKESSIDELQELYVKTFELNSICTPYVGVHIFGEDGFKRGNFMARLKQAFKDNNLEIGTELPDHISLILKLASSLKDENKFNALLSECIINPTNLMLNEFGCDIKNGDLDDDASAAQYWNSASLGMTNRQKINTVNEVKDNSNPYQHLLLTIKTIAESSLTKEPNNA